MSNSPLVSYTKLSPNCTKPRKNGIKKITIHHMAGNLSVEACGEIFASAERKASANYGIGTDGRVGLYVDEGNRAWTSSSSANDDQAVTIEVSNDEVGGNWHVSDIALQKTIALCEDICRRNGIKALVYTGDTTGNLTRHNMFAATSCPGPYLQSKFPYIADEVNKKLKKEEEEVAEAIYNTLDEVPDWGKATIEKLLELGLLVGEDSGLNISHTMLRILVINDRAGLYDSAPGA